jgi:hypothetical protein
MPKSPKFENQVQFLCCYRACADSKRLRKESQGSTLRTQKKTNILTTKFTAEAAEKRRGKVAKRNSSVLSGSKAPGFAISLPLKVPGLRSFIGLAFIILSIKVTLPLRTPQSASYYRDLNFVAEPVALRGSMDSADTSPC